MGSGLNDKVGSGGLDSLGFLNLRLNRRFIWLKLIEKKVQIR